MTSAGIESRVMHLSWDVVGRRLDQGAIALLPIGAASKEHGYHLPLGTDCFQAEYYATRLAERFDALIWPVVNYGYYPVFTDYPGSVTLGADTFTAMVAEILNGIAAAGASACALLNTGISTIDPLRTAVSARDNGFPVTLVNCYEGPRFTAAREALETQAFGGHADEIETSLMLAIEPRCVDLNRAEGNRTAIARGRFNRTDPDAPNYSPSGVNGAPELAGAEKGRRLLAALLDDCAAALAAAPRRR